MNNTTIAIFLSVARTKNYTVSAHELYASKQFISKSIQALEQELDVPLFFRDHHAVELTEAGQRFLTFFQQCDSRYCSTNRNNRLFCEQKYIYVAVEDWVGMSPLVLRVFQRFQTAHNCRIRIQRVGDGKAIGLLVSGEADAAITSNYCSRRFYSMCNVQQLDEVGLRLHISAVHELAGAEVEDILQYAPLLDTYVGEHSEAEVRVRLSSIFNGFMDVPQRISIQENLSSVFAQLLLCNGVTVGPVRHPTSKIVTIPLRRTVTTTFVHMKDSFNPLIPLLQEELSAEIGGRTL